MLFHSQQVLSLRDDFSKSTDFEVHRNWMAITYEKPLREWYFEKTSEWTLDYPPFFAFFEWLLSIPASLIDREMVKVENLYFSAKSVIYYQRATVIVSDLVFLYGCVRYFQAEAKISKSGRFDLLRLAFNYASAAFLVLDNIHFQYNSMMYGMLLLSIAYIKEDHYFKSALVYAILLNFKHIYLYCAPCFGIIYLKKVVFGQTSFWKGLTNLILLATQTIIVFSVSFGPFIYVGGVDQLKQIAYRLFPFQRGLVHHYWAANAWSIYVFLNKYIVNAFQSLLSGKKLQCIFEVDQAHELSTYKQWSAIATLVFLVPIIFMMFKRLDKNNFNFYLATTNFIVFNFGFHVHEKAILMTIIPMMLDTHANSDIWSKVRLTILKTVALWTFLPLLISPKETIVKHMIFTVDLLLTLRVFLRLQTKDIRSTLQIVLFYSSILCIIILQVWQVFIVEYYLQWHEGWMHRYQDFVPAVATVFNQIIFIEMIYKCFKQDKESKKQKHE